MNGKTRAPGGTLDELLGVGPARPAFAEEVAATDTDELSCGAFGYLRGHHERSLSLELRFRTGNREWFSYNLLASARYDASCGILIKFTTGDVVTLVLIRGSNLDLPVGGGQIDLIEGGLKRHRVLWLREMDQDELRRIGVREPTIDGIVVAEFSTREEMQAWLEETAPAFVRR